MSKTWFRGFAATVLICVSAGSASASNFNDCLKQYFFEDLTDPLAQLIVALQEQLDTRPDTDPYYALLSDQQAQAQVYLSSLGSGSVQGQAIRLLCGIDVSPS